MTDQTKACETEPETLKGEGDVERIVRRRVRNLCDVCRGDVAMYCHTFLLEGARSNPQSSAYGKDDISYCVDEEIFVCKDCEPVTPIGCDRGGRFSCNEKFANSFLKWEEVSKETVECCKDEHQITKKQAEKLWSSLFFGDAIGTTADDVVYRDTLFQERITMLEKQPQPYIHTDVWKSSAVTFLRQWAAALD